MSELRTQTKSDLGMILSFETLGTHHFRAHHHLVNHAGGIFGGSMLAQSLHAAELDGSDRVPHSLHAQFLANASADLALEYEVTTIREGGTFSRRRVSARQKGRLVFEANVSLQIPVTGFAHAASWHSPPPLPMDVPSLQELASTWADRLPPAQWAIIQRFSSAIETRLIDPDAMLMKRGPPQCRFWVRPKTARGTLLPSRYASLAFVSDWLMPAACNRPHVDSTFDTALKALSLDHAMWFHAPSEPDGWMLYEANSPWAGEGRGLNFGRLYGESGLLLAHTAQEQYLIGTPAPTPIAARVL
jgi:acyl-CoA thioesterase-2